MSHKWSFVVMHEGAVYRVAASGWDVSITAPSGMTMDATCTPTGLDDGYIVEADIEDESIPEDVLCKVESEMLAKHGGAS